MDGSSPLGPSAPARDSDSPAPLSRHSMARAPPFGPRASPRLRLRPCTSADSAAPQATLHLSRPGTILPPPHLVAAYAAPLGPCFLPLRQPPAPPAASHLRPCLAQCLPHIHGLGAFSQHSPRLGSPSHARSAPHHHGPLPLALITPLRPGRPSGQPQSRMAWCFRLSHVPSDRAGPRGSPSLGWPGPLHLYLTADRAGLKGPAPASAGLDHIPVTSPPTGPALGAAPVSDGLDHSCHVPSDRAGPRGSPRLGRSGRPDSGMRQLKSPHGEDMSLCSNSGRASAAPSRYHYDGRSSGVQPRRIAPGAGEEPTTSPGIIKPLVGSATCLPARPHHQAPQARAPDATGIRGGTHHESGHQQPLVGSATCLPARPHRKPLE